MSYHPTTIGFNNNNVGNIKTSSANDWEGSIGNDGTFEIFENQRMGIRAEGIVLNSYLERGIPRTTRDILNEWAPSGGEDNNNTEAYIEDVSGYMNLHPDEQIPDDRMPEFMSRIAYHENGTLGNLTMDDFRAGWDMANGQQPSQQSPQKSQTTPKRQTYTPSNNINRRLSRLMMTKEEKVAAFNSASNYKIENFSNSFTDTGDGYVEHNGNKIWDIATNWSKGQNSFAEDYMEEKYSLPNSSRRDRRSYRFGTKDLVDASGNPIESTIEGYAPIKDGLTSGRFNAAERRYIPEADKYGKIYGWDPGPRGVDINKKTRDVNLDFVAATASEALKHSSQLALENRLIRKRTDGYYDYLSPTGYKVIDKEERDRMFGSGSSEYYLSYNSIYDDNYSLTDEEKAEVITGINKAMEITAKRYNRNVPTASTGVPGNPEAVASTVEPYRLNPIINTLAGFGATFVNELLYKPADAIGDLTGLYDLGTEEELTSRANKQFGYDPKAAEEAIRNIGNYWDTVANSEASVAERMRAAGNGIIEAFTTPEMLGTSLGALMSWVAPGSFLKLIGIGSKFANASKVLNTAVNAGEMTKKAARLQKAKNFMSLDGAKDLLRKQSGFMTSSMGNINAQYEEFVAYNNGVGLSGVDKAKWFAGRFAVQMFNQNLDKLVDFNIIKSPGLFAAAVPAIKAMTKGEFGTLVGVMAKGLSKTTINMGSEAAQEYSQTMMELYNSRYGSEQFKDLDTFVKFLSSPEHIREGGIAALAGAGGSLQFELVGSVKPLLGGAVGLLGNIKVPGDANTPIVVPTETPPSEDEVKIAKNTYADLLSRTQTYIVNSGVNETNIGMVLDDLDNLNTTKHIISTSSPELQAEAEARYSGVVVALKEFVSNNPDIKLTRRVIAKTIVQSKEDKDLKEAASDAAQDNNPTNVKQEDRDEQSSRVIAKYGDVVSIETDNIDVLNKDTKETAIAHKITFADGTVLRTVPSAGSISINEGKGSFEGIPDISAFIGVNNIVDKDTTKSTILGSSPNSGTENTNELFEETEYDDYSRAVVAERIYNTLLGSGSKTGKLDEGFKKTLTKFAINNGVPQERIDTIEKSYASVEEEALRGSSGYVARLSRLKGMAESSNPNLSEITRENKAISIMHSGLVASSQALTRGIKAAKEKATELNKGILTRSKPYSSPTEYKQYNTKNQKYDKPFNIWVSNVDGKWIARTEEAEKRLAEKVKYIKDIDNELVDIGIRYSGKIPGFEINTGKFVIPVKEGKYKAVQQQNAAYIASSTKIIQDIKPDSTIVTKIILGEKTHAKWAPKGDYYKANALIINSEEFTSDDIVVIDSLGKTKKGKNFYIPSFGKEAKKSIDAASEAGATFILDHSFFSEKSPQAASIITGFLGRNKGYTMLEGKGRTILIKKTAENEKAVEARKEQMAIEKAEDDSKEKNKSDLVTLNRSLELNINHIDGEPLSKARSKNLTKKFNKLFKVVLKDSFEGNADNLRTHLDNRLKNDARKEAVKILRELGAGANPDPINYEDKAFEAQVKNYIESESNKDLLGSQLMEDWAAILNSEATRKEKGDQINRLIDSVSEGEFSASSMIKSILNDRSFAKGKNDIYENIFEVAATGEEVVKPIRKPLSNKEYESLIAANNTDKGNRFGDGKKKHIFLDTRRVVQDATKLVDVSKTTVANSIPTAYLPFTLRDGTENLIKHAKKALAKVSKPELEEQTDRRENGYFLDGNLYLHNSPARGLIFNNDGEVNPEVMTALQLALGELLSTDVSKFSRGWKSDIDIGKMFGVEEFEVTQDMRDFAYEHGSPLRTAANSIGKGMLAQLGLTKKIGKDTSAHEYESLVSDLGNTAIVIAEAAGLLETSTTESNELASLYRDGEIRENDAFTYFVHLKDKKVDTGEYISNEPIEAVEAFIASYEEYAEDLPDIKTDRKEPSRDAPDEYRLDKAKNEIRNDITNAKVPKAAKKTLEILMKTEYNFDLARVKEFLDAIGPEKEYADSPVMSRLGWIDLGPEGEGSKAFNALYYKDKQIQKGKNRDLEKSIDELRKLMETIETEGKEKSVSLYFDYFYSGNDRYMLDSNTINPQVDKIHRFLVTPKAHEMEYEITIAPNGGLVFNVNNTEDPADIDQSYTVRMAIAQGLGKGVDKMAGPDIIEYSDAMLGMSLAQLKKAKKVMLSTGEFEVTTGTGDGKKTHEGNGEEITHALQVFNFLESVKKATSKGGFIAFKSPLSLEFDSLTSGFFNKIQQMPILKDMHEHFARTGILTIEYQRLLREDMAAFKGEGVAFSTDLHAVGDVLDTPGFLDSYKNLANRVITILRTRNKQIGNLTESVGSSSRSGQSLFEVIKPMMPGGEAIGTTGTIDINTILRNLFKDPFMIFNYSASIKRIVRNLGNNVAHDIARDIARANFAKQTDIKEIAEDLLDSIDLLDDDGELIESPKRLQEVLLSTKLSKIRLARPLDIGKLPDDKESVESKNLEQVLENLVSLTYGEAVKDVFNDSFEEFIEIQDAMNDTYKVAFRIFDKKRIELLEEVRRNKKPDYFLSAEDHAKVLEDLWDDFPWIVGPLTGSSNKGKVQKDVINIVTTSVRSPNAIEMSRKKPQAMLSKGSTYDTRKVTPLVRYLEEAISAGSVLPFHALDGSEISGLLNDLDRLKITESSIAAIHDAVIAPLDKSDIVGFTYNKNTSEINSKYVLVDEIARMVERIKKTTSKTEFSKEFKKVSVKGFKTIDDKDKLAFPEAVSSILDNMLRHIAIVNRERKKWYGKDGLLEGAHFGNMVSTPGATYTKDSSKPESDIKLNLNYKKEFMQLYKSLQVTVEDEVKVAEGSVKKLLKKVPPQIINRMLESGLLEDILKADNSGNVENLVDIIEEDPRVIDLLVDDLEEFKEERAGSKNVITKIEKVIEGISSLLVDNITTEEAVPTGPISENSTNSENNATMSNIINDDLNTCKT